MRHFTAAQLRTAFRIALIAWAFVWVMFFIRGFVKGEAADYAALLNADAEGKRAYVSGEEFYAFIEFSKNVIPAGAQYTVVAEYDRSMDYFRYAYYMYPAVRDTGDPVFIACYKKQCDLPGYRRVAELAHDKYILKRTDNDSGPK